MFHQKKRNLTKLSFTETLQRPSASKMHLHSFQVSSCLYRHKSAENELTVNMGAVLEDFLLLGYGLVQRFIFSDPNGALKSNPCTQADVSE